MATINTDYLRCPIVGETGENYGFKATLNSSIGSDCFTKQMQILIKKLFNELKFVRDSNGKKNIKDIKICWEFEKLPMCIFQNFKTNENEITLDDMLVYTHGKFIIDVYVKRKNSDEAYYKVILTDFWRNKGTSMVHMGYQIYNVSDDFFITRDIKSCMGLI